MGTGRVEHTVEIDAPIDHVYGTLTDFEAFPEWDGGCKEARVLERDADGRGTKVELHIDLKVKKLRYVNEYKHDPPGRLEFRMLEGDLKSSEGEHVLEDLGGRTRVTHQVELDPGMFVPGPIKKKLTEQSLKGYMNDLKERCEATA